MEWEVILPVVVFFGVVVGLGFYLSRKSWRSIRSNYEKLAGTYGLELTQPAAKGFGLFQASPHLFGNWKGRKMSIQTVSAGLKDSRQAETAVHLETGLREDCVLVIRSKRGLNRLERVEFKKLVRIKGPTEEFDRRLSISSNRPDWVSERISASMCERILKDLGDTSGSGVLVKGRLTYRETGLISGTAALERIGRMAGMLLWFAEVMEGECEAGEEHSGG